MSRAASHIDAFLAIALPRCAELMKADPEDATPEGRELSLLAQLAELYEKQKYPEFAGRHVNPPDPQCTALSGHDWQPAEQGHEFCVICQAYRRASLKRSRGDWR